MKKKTLITIGISALVVLPLVGSGIYFASAIGIVNEETSYKKETRHYSLNEYNAKFNSSFTSLNKIEIANTKTNYKLDQDYIDGINSFASKIYNALPEKENTSFSPLGLYSNLSLVSLGSANQKVKDEFDALLGSSEEIRTKNYGNMYTNDFYIDEEASLQMYNGYFQSSKYQYNQDFLDKLQSYYCEAYSLNLNNDSDVSKMLKWVDSKIDEKDFLKKEDLNIDEDSASFYFSTVYFNAHWDVDYNPEKTRLLPFTKADGTISNVNFMRHEYRGRVEDYGKYLSCTDSYKNGFKVKYFVPKDINDNIYDLVDKSTILTNTNCEVVEKAEINLSVPKIKTKEMINFKEILQSVGLNEPFEKLSKPLNNAFINLKEEDSMYLDFVKQKNVVSFQEDGTIIKSVTVSGIGKATSVGPIERDIYVIELNQPFIYVVYDLNGLPLYIGNIDNPKN